MCNSSLLVYDPCKDYKSFAVEYTEVLSEAIEYAECGNTSRYINIMENIDMSEYYNLPNYVVQQTLYGYIDQDVLTTNEQWFELIKSMIINYRIIVLVYEHCELNEIYPKKDMHIYNAGKLSETLFDGTAHLHEKYQDCLPVGVDLSTWPLMQVQNIAKFFIIITM